MFINRLALGALAALSLALSATPSLAEKQLKSIGISVGDLANPYFVAIGEGADREAHKLGGPGVKVTTVSSKYDLNTQVGQIENFIANKTDIILVNAVDFKGVEPVLKKARAAGIVVVAIDVGAAGADATVMSDNLAAGTASCSYLAKAIGGKGNVVIVNGPPVTSVMDRVTGCKKAFAQDAGIKVLSDNQNAQGSRDGGLDITSNLLTANGKIDGIFAVNDQTAVGASLAVKQAHRSDVKVITAIDGSPDAESALKDKAGLFAATAAQNPYRMATLAVDVGVAIMNGKPPAQKMTLLKTPMITKSNIASYPGWTKNH